MSDIWVKSLGQWLKFMKILWLLKIELTKLKLSFFWCQQTRQSYYGFSRSRFEKCDCSKKRGRFKAWSHDRFITIPYSSKNSLEKSRLGKNFSFHFMLLVKKSQQFISRCLSSVKNYTAIFKRLIPNLTLLGLLSVTRFSCLLYWHFS